MKVLAKYQYQLPPSLDGGIKKLYKKGFSQNYRD